MAALVILVNADPNPGNFLVETADEMGFSSLLTATNFHAENDAWTASVATLARTQGAGLLIAVRPGMFHPAIFAKMASTAAT